MKVYMYDKLTKELIGESEARRDPLESKLRGEDVFAIPANCTDIVPPEVKYGEIAVFNEEKQVWKKVQSHKGEYKVDKTNGIISLITDNLPLKSTELLVPTELVEDMKLNPLKYEMVNGEIKDISKTQKYAHRVNKLEYERLIKEARDNYDTFLETPVEYKGKQYLPRYIDDYAKLQFRQFPIEIWDATGMYSSVMTEAEFLNLKSYLEDLVNKAYKVKKDKIKNYREKIQKIGE